ncbi:MAG: hypothetical protein N2Z23_02565 [Pyrinomonadaceae bacterium]|nr:hypothetical protein [Pyrinomonadaceae bacterium]
MTTKFLLLTMNLVLLFAVSFSQKLKAEDVLSKHLEKIEGLSKLKNIVASGTVSFTMLRAGGAGGSGKIVIASEDNKLLLGMSFMIPNYPGETIIFDGKDSKIAFAINNARSEFGNYIFRYPEVLREGLLGGPFLTHWALKKLKSSKAKISLDGIKKVNGREAYVLEYQPKGSFDLEIRIFIDKETFHHVRTEYFRVISAIQGPNPDASASRRERREEMIEEFSDYKVVNQIEIPHSYRIYLMIEGQSRTNEYEWKANFSQFFFNQELDPNTFVVK